MEESTTSASQTRSSYKRVVDLLILSATINIAFYLLSLAGSTLDFIDYVVADSHKLLEPTETLLDLVVVSILNVILLTLALVLMRSYPQVRKGTVTRIFFSLVAILLFAFLLLKVVLVALFGTALFRTLSFFVYASLLTSFLVYAFSIN